MAEEIRKRSRPDMMTGITRVEYADVADIGSTDPAGPDRGLNELMVGAASETSSMLRSSQELRLKKIPSMAAAPYR